MIHTLSVREDDVTVTVVLLVNERPCRADTVAGSPEARMSRRELREARSVLV